MAITIDAYSVTETVSTTEWSFTTDSSGPDSDATDGIYQSLIDVSALTVAETFKFVLYEKVTSGGTQRAVMTWYLTGVQADPHYLTMPSTLGHGFDITVTKIAGTDRSITIRTSKVA